MTKALFWIVILTACGDVAPVPDATLLPAADAAGTDSMTMVDADTRRPCSCELPCQNGLCCEGGYCLVPPEDPLRCVYGDVSEVPDAAVCE